MELEAELEKLSPQPGELIIVRGNFPGEEAYRVRQIVLSHVPEGVQVLVGPHDVTFEHLDARQVESLRQLLDERASHLRV